MCRQRRRVGQGKISGAGNSRDASRQPLVRQQVGELILGMGGDSLEYVPQVGERIDVMPLTGGNEAG